MPWCQFQGKQNHVTEQFAGNRRDFGFRGCAETQKPPEPPVSLLPPSSALLWPGHAPGSVFQGRGEAPGEGQGIASGIGRPAVRDTCAFPALAVFICKKAARGEAGKRGQASEDPRFVCKGAATGRSLHLLCEVGSQRLRVALVLRELCLICAKRAIRSARIAEEQNLLRLTTEGPSNVDSKASSHPVLLLQL